MKELPPFQRFPLCKCEARGGQVNTESVGMEPMAGSMEQYGKQCYLEKIHCYACNTTLQRVIWDGASL